MWVAGLDEAGRGCLAGPVYAAAVILPQPCELPRLNDSKKLSPQQREALVPEIHLQALAWAVAWASVQEIERLNILHASLLAMRRAFEGLTLRPARALVDGNRAPALDCVVETVVEGDATVPCIMAASVLAKVARDREMCRLDEHYPGYGFARHKGYGTEEHMVMLQRLGPTPIHRRGFAPVAQQMLDFGS